MQSRTTDAQRGNSLHCMAENSLPLPNFYTQLDGTLFFLIFTYFWGKSHWSFRNYGSNGAIYYFLIPTKTTSDFILSYLKKAIGGAFTKKYQKQIWKSWYLHYGWAPGGVRGVKKLSKPNWRLLWRVSALSLAQIE